MPQDEDEVPVAVRGIGSDELYCLLENDDLIAEYSAKSVEANESPVVEDATISVTVSRGLSTHGELYRF
jgi:hypothetical protein